MVFLFIALAVLVVAALVVTALVIPRGAAAARSSCRRTSIATRATWSAKHRPRPTPTPPNPSPRAGSSPRPNRRPPALETPEPTAGRLLRLRARLARSQSALGRGLLSVLSRDKLDEDAWEEIEEALLTADVGVGATTEIVDRLRTRTKVLGTARRASCGPCWPTSSSPRCSPTWTARCTRRRPATGRPS